MSVGQLTDLVARVNVLCGDKFVSRGRPLTLGLIRSVAMVVCLMRKNPTQDFIGALFGVSQSTVSRRWDVVRPVIGDVLGGLAPTPRDIVGRGTVLVDWTVCPMWDWQAVPDLYSAKVGFAGMNLQVAASLDGDLVAVGPSPVHGADTTRTRSLPPAWPACSPISCPWPISAMSVSTASKAVSSTPVNSNSTAPSARRGWPSSTRHRAPQDLADAQ